MVIKDYLLTRLGGPLSPAGQQNDALLDAIKSEEELDPGEGDGGGALRIRLPAFASLSKARAAEKTHRCDVCPKWFCSLGQLVRHRRAHRQSPAERPVARSPERRDVAAGSKGPAAGGSMQECGVCQATFGSLGALVVHMRSLHGVQRAYSCALCGRKFRRRRFLTQHRRSRTCEACGKWFDCVSVMAKHKRSMCRSRT